MYKDMTKRQCEKYEERAVVIDGDMFPPDHPKVKAAKNELREIQQNYVDMKVDDFTEQINQKMEEISEKISEYAKTQTVVVRDEKGEIIDKKAKIAGQGMDEFVINRIFFNSLTPLSSKEPKYNAEKLAIVFDFYENVVATINQKICRLLPTKSHFCRFAGITTATYNGYKLSEDPDMQVVIEKIEDMLSDVHLTMAQEKKLDTTATKYRMNIEMGKRENYNPQVVIKADIKDLEEYKNRINSLETLYVEGEVSDE